MPNEIELKPCPFCGGEAKISFSQHRFGGKNDVGKMKISYRVQAICNKCKSRGKPIVTPLLINPNPYRSSYYLNHNKSYLKKTHYSYPKHNCEDEMFMPYIKSAIEAWNRRANDEPRS